MKSSTVFSFIRCLFCHCTDSLCLKVAHVLYKSMRLWSSTRIYELFLIHDAVTDSRDISPWPVQSLILKEENAKPYWNSIMGYNAMYAIKYHCFGGDVCLNLLRRPSRSRHFFPKCWQLYTSMHGVIFVKVAVYFYSKNVSTSSNVASNW